MVVKVTQVKLLLLTLLSYLSAKTADQSQVNQTKLKPLQTNFSPPDASFNVDFDALESVELLLCENGAI
jgi:hypothetical protein